MQKGKFRLFYIQPRCQEDLFNKTEHSLAIIKKTVNYEKTSKNTIWQYIKNINKINSITIDQKKKSAMPTTNKNLSVTYKELL